MTVHKAVQRSDKLRSDWGVRRQHWRDIGHAARGVALQDIPKACRRATMVVTITVTVARTAFHKLRPEVETDHTRDYSCRFLPKTLLRENDK